MFLQCLCGVVLNDNAAPNRTEHRVLDGYAVEKIQDLVDEEVAKEGTIDSWPEHWDASGAIRAFRCHQCKRIHLGVDGKKADIVVYNVERVGLP